MNTLAKTLFAFACTSLAVFSGYAAEPATAEQAENEYTYQYQQTQGELSGDRELVRDRDRDQERQKLRIHDPKAGEDKAALQVRKQEQQRNSVGEQSGELVQERSQNQQRLMNQEQADDDAMLRNRNQLRHKLIKQTGSSRMGGGAGRR